MPTGFAPGFVPGRALGLLAGVDAMFAELLRLAAGRPVFTADYYILDPVSGKVLAFVDWNDPRHLLIQTDATKQVLPPVSHKDYGGRLCATFTGLQWYASNRLPAYWRPWNDGTGGGATLSVTPTEVTGTYYAVSNTFAVPGFAMAWNTLFTSIIVTAAASTAVVASASPVVPTVDVPVQYEFTYTEGASPEYYVKATGAAATTGVSILPPTVGDPAASMRLGARTDGSIPMKARWRHLVFHTGITAPLRLAIGRYIQQETGIAP